MENLITLSVEIAESDDRSISPQRVSVLVVNRDGGPYKLLYTTENQQVVSEVVSTVEFKEALTNLMNLLLEKNTL